MKMTDTEFILHLEDIIQGENCLQLLKNLRDSDPKRYDKLFNIYCILGKRDNYLSIIKNDWKYLGKIKTPRLIGSKVVYKDELNKNVIDWEYNDNSVFIVIDESKSRKEIDLNNIFDKNTINNLIMPYLGIL
jgi:hypothetical protein